MIGISIIQPYASLIATGFKTIQTCTWSPGWKGEILICANKSKELELEPEFLFLLNKLRYPLPKGMALCIAKIDRYAMMDVKDEFKACCRIYPQARSWHLSNIRSIEPFPVKDHLRHHLKLLFQVEMP